MSTGAVASNPIVVVERRHHGGDAAHPIVINDEESDDEALPRYIPAAWPAHVAYWRHNRNPRHIQFRLMNLGPCDCTRWCSTGCTNFDSAIYCTTTNCGVGQLCGNRLLDLPSLAIMRCIKGLGIMTTTDIPKGIVLGEYCGKIVPQSRLTTAQVDHGFVLKFKSRADNGEVVFVDAYPGFINHSCSPNSKFEERAFGTKRKMVVTSITDIHAGEEITAKYSNDVPFVCLCGEANCVSRRQH